MSKRARPGQLAIVPTDDDAARAREVDTARTWSDVEARVIKHALASGVRRISDLAIRVDEFQDRRARDAWAATHRMIEAGSRAVWIGGALEAEIAKVETITTARDVIAWVKAAADEMDPDEVDALLQSIRDRNFAARASTLAGRLIEVARSGHREAGARASVIVGELRSLDATRHTGGTGLELVSAIDAWDEWYEQAQGERTAVSRMPLIGIPTVDRWTKRYEGKATYIAGQSHCGKTGVIAGAVLATARAGIPAAFISIEDTWGEIVARIASELGRFNTMEVTNPQLPLDLPERIARGRLALVGLPVHGLTVDDRTLDTVLVMVRKAAARGCKLVAVDHYHAIARPKWAAKGGNRRDWQDELLGELLKTGAELGVHLLIGSQVTRDKTRKSVGLGDMRESSQLEESAQNLIGLSPIESKDGKRRVLCTIAKAKGTSGAGKSVTMIRDAFGVLVEESMADADPGEWGGS